MSGRLPLNISISKATLDIYRNPHVAHLWEIYN